MLSYLLFYRFLVLNILLFSLAGVAVWTGLALPLYREDASYITWGITALFLVGWWGTARETWRVSRMLNAQKREGAKAGSAADRDKVLSKIEWLHKIEDWLVRLGLLGTIIGFYMALPEGITPDLKGAQSAIAGLMAGMKTAITTTILGSVLALWQDVQLRMLNTGISTYWQDRILKAERLRP